MYRKAILLALTIAFTCSTISCGVRIKEYLTQAECSQIESKKTIWIIAKDSTEYKVKEPTLKDSKIVGLVNGQIGEIEFSEIAFVEAKKTDAATLSLTIVGVLFAIYFASLFAFPN